MKIDFTDIVVTVTGAAQGNGSALARGFAASGARVALVDLKSGAAERVAQEIRSSGGVAHAFAADVSDPQSCRTLATGVREVLGPTGVLVNNAGILIRGPLDSPSAVGDWAQTLSVNLGGPYFMTLAFLSQLEETAGVILNVGSIQSFVATPNSAAYTASKGGVRQLTQAMACELAPRGIRVNAIAPGFIATPMTEVTRGDPQKMQSLLNHVPMKRYGEPDELIGPALMLCSRHASYVTGAIVPIDGGYLAC